MARSSVALQVRQGGLLMLSRKFLQRSSSKGSERDRIHGKGCFQLSVIGRLGDADRL